MAKAAVFLDRDGTIIEDVGYLADVEGIKLLPGSAEALMKLSDAGFALVIVSNQSGVARGMFDEAAVQRVNQALEDMLSQRGIELAAVYYCPYYCQASEDGYKKESDLRKPSPGMLLKAAQELDVDLSRSWMIGDDPDDVEAGVAAGCKTILLTKNNDSQTSQSNNQAADLKEAAEKILQASASSFQAGQTIQKDQLIVTLGNIESLTQDIRNEFRQLTRLGRHTDFSFHKMTAALIQILAIAMLFWAGITSIDVAVIPPIDSINLKMLAAIALQLLALTFFLLDRQR